MTDDPDPLEPMPPANLPGSVWRQVRPNFHKGERLFNSGPELWAAACEYFEWVEDNPLKVEKVFQNNGMIVRADTPKARVMTIQGLCLFLGISRDTFHKWSVATDTDLLQSTCLMIRDVIYAQKFEGAASDLFNPTVISRDLGLRDVKEMTGPNGGPMQMISSDMSAQEAAAAYAATLQDDEDQLAS